MNRLSEINHIQPIKDLLIGPRTSLQEETQALWLGDVIGQLRRNADMENQLGLECFLNQPLNGIVSARWLIDGLKRLLKVDVEPIGAFADVDDIMIDLSILNDYRLKQTSFM